MARKKPATTRRKNAAARTLSPRAARSVTGGFASHAQGASNYQKKNVTTIRPTTS